MFLREILSDTKFEIIRATSANEAVHLNSLQIFDIVLFDMFSCCEHNSLNMEAIKEVISNNNHIIVADNNCLAIAKKEFNNNLFLVNNLADIMHLPEVINETINNMHKERKHISML